MLVAAQRRGVEEAGPARPAAIAERHRRPARSAASRAGPAAATRNSAPGRARCRGSSSSRRRTGRGRCPSPRSPRAARRARARARAAGSSRRTAARPPPRPRSRACPSSQRVPERLLEQVDEQEQHDEPGAFTPMRIPKMRASWNELPVPNIARAMRRHRPGSLALANSIAWTRRLGRGPHGTRSDLHPRRRHRAGAGGGDPPRARGHRRRVRRGTSIRPARTSTTRRATPFPDRTLDSIKRTGVGIKGPTTTPVGSGFRSVNVLLRKELDLYACIRPCKAYEGVRTRFPETDIVIVRENTEDLYAGIEFEQRHRGGREAARVPRRRARRSPVREHSGISIKPISVFGSERIVEPRSTTPRENGRKKVDGRAQGQHHEVLRRPVPRGRAQGRRGLPRHRVRGPHHRQPVQPARVAARRSTT